MCFQSFPSISLCGSFVHAKHLKYKFSTYPPRIYLSRHRATVTTQFASHYRAPHHYHHHHHYIVIMMVFALFNASHDKRLLYLASISFFLYLIHPLYISHSTHIIEIKHEICTRTRTCVIMLFSIRLYFTGTAN